MKFRLEEFPDPLSPLQSIISWVRKSYEDGTIHISSPDFSDPCLNVKSMTSNTVIVLGA